MMDDSLVSISLGDVAKVLKTLDLDLGGEGCSMERLLSLSGTGGRPLFTQGVN